MRLNESVYSSAIRHQYETLVGQPVAHIGYQRLHLVVLVVQVEYREGQPLRKVTFTSAQHGVVHTSTCGYADALHSKGG